jgi:hypothetical protein
LSDDDRLKADRVRAGLKRTLQDMEEEDLPSVLAALLGVMIPMLVHVELERWEQKSWVRNKSKRIEGESCSR